MKRWPIILTLPLVLIAGAYPAIPAPSTASGDWLVEVEGEGGYWIGPETLRTLGIASPDGSPPTLRLSRFDQPIPHLPLRTGSGWGVFFYTAEGATRYTRRTAFRLEAGHPGETTPIKEPPIAGPPSDGGLVTLHREEDVRYLPQADVETPWVWERLYTPGATAHTLSLPGGLPGPITATVRVWSHTAAPANPDHALRLTWDEQTVGEWEWDGQGMHHLTASWDEPRPEAEHVLGIETPALPDVPVAMVWVDGWDVTYRRRIEPDGTIWQAERTGVHIQDANAETRVLDVTEPLAPIDLGPLPEDGIAGTVPGRQYWVGNPTQAPAPLAVRPARTLGIDSLAEVEYLAIAPLAFHAPLEPLLEHRRSQGLAAHVVDVQAVYDAFGDGRPDPEPVRRLVQGLPNLRYLLVVGDGTAEPGGYDGRDGALRVVVPLTRTGVLGETPADVLLGTNEEGHPRVAVGRFPATSIGEVRAMVRKTIAWESAGSPPAGLILSDDEAQFSSAALDIAGLLPEGITVQHLDAGDEQSRAMALETLRQGSTWVNYTGHGSLTLLCDEGTLILEDGETWEEPAVMVAWTCLAGHFVHPAQDSIGEAWLRVPRGGLAAFLGPVGETTTGEQTPFARAFYAALQEEGRLGDAWLTAIQREGSRDVLLGYTILGDPGLWVVGE